MGCPRPRIRILRPAGRSNLDQFCSTVETDVYFCRKFVDSTYFPVWRVACTPAVSPAMPLDGKSFRPASAQTFLQQCGVPAVLAKYVVVQRERGPERIVEDCVSGEFGEPKDLTPVANAPVAQSDANTESVRLESVTIKNFRAYRKPHTFALGADVTILYGPNGFGKTSFFDAIDFAVTGGIGRIESSSEAHFAKTAQHLDTGSEESNRVSLFSKQWCCPKDHAERENPERVSVGRSDHRPQNYFSRTDRVVTFQPLTVSKTS